MVDCPFRQVVDDVVWPAGITTGHRQCCKSSGPPLTQSMREALEGSSKDPCILKFNAEFRDKV